MDETKRKHYLELSIEGYRHAWLCGNIPPDGDISELLTYPLRPEIETFLREWIEGHRSKIQQASAAEIVAATKRVEAAARKTEKATIDLKTPKVLVVLGVIASLASIVAAWPTIKSWFKD